jgi:hypothetical protein
VLAGIELALDRVRDDALRVDDVGDAPVERQEQPLGLVEARDVPLLVGDEREREVQRGGELALAIEAVARDADDLGVAALQLRQGLLEAARLERSTGGERLGEEVEDHPAAAQIGEREGVASSGLRREAGRRHADLQHEGESTARSATTGA